MSDLHDLYGWKTNNLNNSNCKTSRKSSCYNIRQTTGLGENFLTEFFRIV